MLSHPLAAHALDVAAVATLLHPRSLDIDLRVLGFLIALHDVGKMSRPFQGKDTRFWPALLGPAPATPPAGPTHDAIGLHLLRDVLGDALRPVLPGWRDGHSSRLWRALAGHHGRPPVEDFGRPLPSVLCDLCRAAAIDFVRAMHDVFRPPPLPRPAAEHDIARLAWQLAGVTTLADWIGSRQAWFPYVAAEAVAEPAAYFWNRALPQAFAALTAAGLAPAPPAPFHGVRHLFPAVTVASPVQEWAQTVVLPAGPMLAVIEDVTGSGKTEAAVTLAHRLLAAGRATGLYVGLPTTATANAMFGRLARAYRALFAATTRPSLALAHGRADLDPQFRAAIAGGEIMASEDGSDPADVSAEAHCAAWLAEDRRRALLAQVGVGTLDQALLAALPVRHAPLRLHGLAGKVLIVDEAHAFDAYMQRELLALLRFQAALGGSAILLSATLPQATRQALADAFRDGLGAPPVPLTGTAYPLTALIAQDDIDERPCAMRAGLARRVMVTRIDDATAALERVIAAAAQKAAVAWVRSTVDDAIAAASALRAHGLAPLLFHARFAMTDRLAIEAQVLRRFGRDSAGADRQGVLVASPVIQESLDIDFDLLCTDLAPADLLIQRAGRLWRHDRGPRPIARPELLVVSPAPVADPPADWIAASQPGTAAVYRDPALLWRSARAVFGRGAIVTPDDMRPLIEAAADRDDVPPALTTAADKAAGRRQAQAGIGEQNVLKVWHGYRRDAGLWETDERTPTRLEERPQVTLRLARLHEGQVVPYAVADDPRRAWALSEVAVARFRMAACPAPPGSEAAVAAARASWGPWERDSERIVLAVLTEAGGRLIVEGRAESGATVVATYDALTGLVWPVPGDAG